jgi:hypothetical protein
LELVTNHLPLYLLASGRRAALISDAQADVRALAEHCNAPRFLSLQADDAASSTGEHHSSMPLRDAAERTLFIQRTLRLVAARLGLRCAGDDHASPSSPSAASLSTSTSAAAPHSPPAHVVLLHLDAESLAGPSAAAPVSTTTQPTPFADAAPAGVEHEQRARIALGMVELLLVTLMAQLKSNPPVASLASAPAASSSSSLAPFSLPVSLPHTVLQAASELLSSRLLCPELMWSIVIDDDDDDVSAAVAISSIVDSAAQLRAQTIAALRPVQSYRVQDGCISRTDERQWRSCSAFVYHAETTRIAAGLDGAVSSSSVVPPSCPSSTSETGPPPPLHGSLHIMHLMRELLFKLGLGSKYGA